MLHTLEVGRVTSKREALLWAKETLHVEWSDLIQGALDDRPEPWLRVHDQPDPEPSTGLGPSSNTHEL